MEAIIIRTTIVWAIASAGYSTIATAAVMTTVILTGILVTAARAVATLHRRPVLPLLLPAGAVAAEVLPEAAAVVEVVAAADNLQSDLTFF
jgi:hypothetical protein